MNDKHNQLMDKEMSFQSRLFLGFPQFKLLEDDDCSLFLIFPTPQHQSLIPLPLGSKASHSGKSIALALSFM